MTNDRQDRLKVSRAEPHGLIALVFCRHTGSREFEYIGRNSLTRILKSRCTGVPVADLTERTQ